MREERLCVYLGLSYVCLSCCIRWEEWQELRNKPLPVLPDKKIARWVFLRLCGPRNARLILVY